MKIAFLCTSLEPGRDAVGDYTRNLAQACAERGHSCALLALRDSHLIPNEERMADAIPALRLSPRLSLAARVADARSCLADFSPDWVSWQFDSYGYHPKGLISAETRALGALTAGRRTHVMLHELWRGMDRQASWFERLAGRAQRRGLVALLHQLRTQRLHTSNVAYSIALSNYHWGAEVLPVFGNVAIAPPRTAALADLLPGNFRNSWLIGVTFGTLHRQWQPKPSAELLQSVAEDLGRKLLLVACGRTGPHGETLLREFATNRDVTVVSTGELPAETLSQIFQDADFGLASQPWALIGRSSSTAAMLDHGLPVVVPRNDWVPRGWFDPPPPPPGLLVKQTDVTRKNAINWLSRRLPPTPSLPRIADAFLESLTRA